MTQDEIIRMAKASGFEKPNDNRLQYFAELVAAKEREACAELKNILHPMNFGGKQTYTTQELLDHMKQSIVDYSNEILARGEA